MPWTSLIRHAFSPHSCKPSSPSCYCSQIKPSYFASMLNSILVFTASSPPAACTEFHTKPLVYISTAIKPRPRREVPKRVTEVQGYELIFNFCSPSSIHPFALGKKISKQTALRPSFLCVCFLLYFLSVAILRRFSQVESRFQIGQ